MVLNGAMVTVQPNCGQDISHLDVYKEFAIRYLEHPSDLDILKYVVYGEEGIIRSLPSWVPRWDCDGVTVAVMVESTERKVTCLENEHDNSSDFSIHTVDGSPALRVRAVIFDSVKYVSELITHHDADEAHEAVRK